MRHADIDKETVSGTTWGTCLCTASVFSKVFGALMWWALKVGSSSSWDLRLCRKERMGIYQSVLLLYSHSAAPSRYSGLKAFAPQPRGTSPDKINGESHVLKSCAKTPRHLSGYSESHILERVGCLHLVRGCTGYTHQERCSCGNPGGAKESCMLQDKEAWWSVTHARYTF